MKLSIHSLLLFFAFLFIAFNAHSQTDTSQTIQKPVYKVVDQMPEFKGGIDKLVEYIQRKLVYPKEARELDISGRVVVSFVVDTKGRVRDAKVVLRVHPLLDDEALRVVNGMPRWKPGSIKNEKVNVEFNLPISFTLK